jgi:putative transcriptional regulator
MARVTSGNFAERLLRSAEQAVAIKQGEAEPAHTSRRKVTIRKVGVVEAPRYDSARILRLRTYLGVSQPIFAGMIGVQPATVKAWEQGQKEPSGAARRLLQVLEVRPSAVVEAARMKHMGIVTTPLARATPKAPARQTGSAAPKRRRPKQLVA